MFFRILYKSFTRALKEKLLIILTVAFGASLASVMLNVALDVGDKMNHELKSYGANIQVLPKVDTIPVELDGINLNPLGKQAFLQEEDLNKLKSIFWANNILGFIPYLETTGKTEKIERPVPLIGTWFHKTVHLSDGNTFTTGISEIKPWWKLTGAWPQEKGNVREIIVGKQLAETLQIEAGSELNLQVNTPQGLLPFTFRVTGVVEAGGKEDEGIYLPIGQLQNILGIPGKISGAEVSALTVPENELAKKAAKDPSTLREGDFDKWYCTAYAGAIAYQIEESIPGAKAKTVRQIAESEGKILNKIQFMMLIISLAAVISSALGISSLMNSKVFERGKEIALMKAIGGTNLSVVVLFISEALISGLIGGLLGYGIGILLSQFLGKSVFGTVLTIKWLGLPLILLLSSGISVLGSYPALRNIVKLEPVKALQGR